MDSKEVKKKRTDVRTNKVEANILYKGDDYDFKCYSWKKIEDNRPLKVAILKSKRKALPEFKFRWDEKPEALDVDILNSSSSVRKKFGRGLKGYKGHHNTRIPDCKGRRIFEALIEIPGVRIFHGYITVPLCRAFRGKANIISSTKGNLTVSKKKG